MAALGIGMEDLIAEVGGKVDPDSLYFPAMQSLYAAREAGITPIGYLARSRFTRMSNYSGNGLGGPETWGLRAVFVSTRIRSRF